MADTDHSRPAIVAFGPFELDVAGGCLRRDGVVVPLRPKAWRMLLRLVREPGALIPTEELYASVWGETAVTPNTMTNVVGELRRALGDTDTPARYIETVHRRGYRFVAEVAAQNRVDVGFIGRTTELAALREALREAAGGDRRAVFVHGEAGLGKTTLVEQFLDGLDAVRAQCVEAHGASEAYMPILHLIEQLLRGPRRDEVTALLRRFAPTWLSQLPWLVTEEESQALSRALAGVGTARMVREGAVLLEELARDRPLVVVLEDLHWSDGPTIDLVATLLQRTGATRLLLVGTYRPIDAVVRGHPVATMVATLRRRRDVRMLPLSAFSLDEVRRCLAHELGVTDDALVGTLATSLGRHTGGNPLFVKAVSAQLRHEGWLRRSDAGWELTVDLERNAPPLPDDLRELLELQIAGLPPERQRVLEAAAVVGADVPVDAVAAALEWDRDRVDDVCHAMAQRALYLRPAGDGYAFTHALYQRAFHDRVAPSERRRLHGRIGDCIERTHAQHLPDVAARLAGHFEAAGDLDRAARHRELAAGVAIRRLAYAEAVRELDTALAHLAKTPGAADAGGRTARIQLGRANALISLRGYVRPEVEDAFARAETVARESGDVREEARALLGLGSLKVGAGEPRAALPFAERGVALASRDPAALPHYAHVRAAHVHLLLGHPARALAYLDLSARERPEPGIPVLVDGIAESEYFRALALTQLGSLDQGRAAADRALRRIDDTGMAWARSVALYFVLETHLLRRDVRNAAPLVDALIDHLRVYDFPTQTHIALFHRRYLRGLAGEPAAVLDDLRRHLADHTAGGERWHHAVHLAELAEIEMRAGELDAATGSLDAAFAHQEQGGEERHAPELWRLRAELRLHRDNVPGAERDFRRAVDVAREREMRLFELRATVGLSRLLRDQGRAAEAGPMLAAIHGGFREGHDAADLRDAATLLHDLRH